MAKTPTPDPFEDAPATPQPAKEHPLTGSLPTGDYKTEQEKTKEHPKPDTKEFEQSKPLGIAPGEPYPTGNPPKDPHEPPPETTPAKP
jgi:hypothetical protein